MADKRISQLVDRGTIANNDVVPIVVSGAVTTNKATISSIQTFMQGNLDLGVTSVGITLGSTGTDVNVTGSPITSSGNITINFPTASATNRGLLSSADWITFNGKQPAGNYVTLDTVQIITAQKSFTGGGSSDSVIISHGSGSGFALDAIKSGNGEVIRVNKTGGSGNAMTVIGGNFEAPTIVRTGGTSVQYLMADGSVSTLTNPITGTLATGQVAFGTAANTVGGDADFTYNSTTNLLTLGGGITLTGAQTIQTSTGNLTLATADNTGIVDIRRNDRALGAELRLTNAFNGTGWISGDVVGTLNFVSADTSLTEPIRSRIQAVSSSVGVAPSAVNLIFSTSNANILTEGFRLTNLSNVHIGAFTTDAGFRLDVNGTARVQGVLTTTADAVVNGVNVGIGGGAITTNTRVGNLALQNNTTGGSNTASGRSTLQNNTTGSFNTASGVSALLSNTTGSSNTASGVSALFSNTTGSANTAIGVQALQNNTTGVQNTANGVEAGRRIAAGTDLTIANNSIFLGVDTRAAADNQTNQIVIGHTAIGLGSNTTVLGNSSTTFGRWFGNLLIGSSTNTGQQLQVTGTSLFTGTATFNVDAVVNGVNVGRGGGAITSNTRVGTSALITNTTGGSNTASGVNALLFNTTGSNNTASGTSALQSNTTGAFNTASGVSALFSNTTGNSNTASGFNALLNNTTGSFNTASGIQALRNNITGTFNTASGFESLFSNTTGTFNTAIGVSALFANITGSFNTALGFDAGRRIAAGGNLTIANNSVFIGRDTRAAADDQTNQIVIGNNAIGLGSNTTVLGNSSTTFGRWFGNLLVGTSTNNGTNLRVVGTTQSDIITQNLASHGKKVLQFTSVSSATINLATEFPLMTGLVVANAYAVFGKYLGNASTYGQAIEFYISKNPSGFWNAVAFSGSSQNIPNLVDVTGSGNNLTITTSTGTSFILELTVMTQA